MSHQIHVLAIDAGRHKEEKHFLRSSILPLDLIVEPKRLQGSSPVEEMMEQDLLLVRGNLRVSF